MATSVESREPPAQPLHMRMNDTRVSGDNTSKQKQGDKTQAKEAQLKVKESPEEKSSVQVLNANSAKARKRTKTGCLTCRRRRIKCGEERPTCNNCVKSKRNCEGYTPRVIFKDPIGARPIGGAFRETGNQFQSITSFNPVEAHHRPLQPRNTGQMPLPVIAPHPSQPEHPVWKGMKPFGAVSDHPDRPIDMAVYTPGDLPPHVLQKIAQRNCSLDTSPVSPEIETFPVHHTALPSQHHPVHHGDRDSGIDLYFVNHYANYLPPGTSEPRYINLRGSWPRVLTFFSRDALPKPLGYVPITNLADSNPRT
ncbi:MAG: hypothetical protein Q9224_000862 [Gallowayella concinna]